MNDLTNVYSKIASTQNKVTQAVTKFAKEFFPFIILILNILVTIGSKLFDTWLENPFTVDFFISLGINLLTTMFCYSCFIKYGEKNEKLCSPSYFTNVDRWSKMSGDVRNHHNDEFTSYCKNQVELEREEKRISYIVNHTMISIPTYNEQYRGKTKADIEKLVEEGKLTKAEARYVNKANSPIYVRPINAISILCGIHGTTANDAVRDGIISNSARSILFRPIGVLILTAVISMVKGVWVGVGDASAIFDMIYSMFMIVISSIMGYSSGANSARKENDRIKGRIYFIEKFLNSCTVQNG